MDARNLLLKSDCLDLRHSSTVEALLRGPSPAAPQNQVRRKPFVPEGKVSRGSLQICMPFPAGMRGTDTAY